MDSKWLPLQLKIQEITAAFGANAKDTGSARVQIAILQKNQKFNRTC